MGGVRAGRVRSTRSGRGRRQPCDIGVGDGLALSAGLYSDVEPEGFVDGVSNRDRAELGAGSAEGVVVDIDQVLAHRSGIYRSDRIYLGFAWSTKRQRRRPVAVHDFAQLRPPPPRREPAGMLHGGRSGSAEQNARAERGCRVHRRGTLIGSIDA